MYSLSLTFDVHIHFSLCVWQGNTRHLLGDAGSAMTDSKSIALRLSFYYILLLTVRDEIDTHSLTHTYTHT